MKIFLGKFFVLKLFLSITLKMCAISFKKKKCVLSEDDNNI